MAKQCQITGKTSLKGNKVSHSNIKTKRKFKPNLQSKKLKNPATGEIIKVKISAQGLKTLSKWQKSGKIYDLRELITK